MIAAQLLTHFDHLADAPDAILRLRRFILDLAVRGKLVPQDPNDEPASELMKRISAEKVRLVRAGVIRKPKSFGIKTDSPYELPTSWSLMPLGEIIVKHLGGGTPSKNNSDYWNGAVPWASVKDVGKSKYLDETIDRITEAGLENSSSNLIEPGNILVVTRMGLGKVSINRVSIAINQDLRALILSDLISIDYAYNFFLTYGFEGTGLTVKGIKLEELLSIPFPLPPLAEQHRIVAKVDELMALCDRLEAARVEREATRDRMAAASLARLNAPDPNPATFQTHAAFALNNLTPLTTRPDQIKTLRQTILNLAVRGKLVPQDPNDEPASELLKRIIAKNRTTFLQGQKQRHPSDVGNDDEVPYNIPVTWAWSSIGQLAFDMRYGTSKKCDYQIKGMPVLRIPNVSKSEVDLTDLKFGALTEKERKALFLRENDLLVVRSNGSLDIVGRAAIVPKAAESMSFAGYLVRVQFMQCYIQTRYVWLVMNSRHVRDLIEKPIRSTVGLKNVNLTELAALTIPLPPLAEQHRIVAKVYELMTLCNQLETSFTTGNDTRRRLLDALLHEAFEHF